MNLYFWKWVISIFCDECDIIAVVIQSLNRVQLFVTPLIAAYSGFSLHHYLPEFHETHIQWVSDDSNHLTLCCHFSSCPQFFTASGTFPLSQLFISGGQSFEASSVLPMNIQSWFLLGWLVRSPAVKGTLKSLLKVQKHQFFGAQPSLWPNSHIHTWLWKKHSFD